MRPNTVTVIGQTFAISWIEDAPASLHVEQKIGTSNLALQSIAIKAEQGEDQQRDTLLHEVLHVSLNIVGALEDEEQQERVVLSLAPVLLNVLRSNPALVAWLTT